VPRKPKKSSKPLWESEMNDKSFHSRKFTFFTELVCDRELGGREVRVAWILIDHINSKTGLCCPSIQTMANKLSYNERTVRRAIKRLENRGWFAREKRGRGTQYNPNYEKLENRTELSTFDEKENRTPLSTKADTTDPESGHTQSNEPTNKPKLKPKAPSGAAVLDSATLTVPEVKLSSDMKEWENAIAAAEPELSRWLGKAKLNKSGNGCIEIRVPSRFIRDQLINRIDTLQEILTKHGNKAGQINITVGGLS
jgi:hypothetical protein